MEAAVHGDLTLLKQAMLHDPLVGAVCNPPEVWRMTDEMVVANEGCLPQYAAEMASAKERLASQPALTTDSAADVLV
jgi:alpha-galactosidase